MRFLILCANPLKKKKVEAAQGLTEYEHLQDVFGRPNLEVHPHSSNAQSTGKGKIQIFSMVPETKKRYSTYVVLQNAVYLGILLVKFTQCSLSKQLLLSSFFLSQSFLIQHLDR